MKEALSRAHDGVLVIPEGYKWCANCDALTPSREEDEKFKWMDICATCGGSRRSDPYDCPNCGWESPEEGGPTAEEVQIHAPGCHNDPDAWPDATGPWGGVDSPATMMMAWFLNDNPQFYGGKFLHRINQACSCPTVTVYRNVQCFGNWSGPSSNRDCMNATDFGWSVLCPVCGCVFEVEGGGC